MIKILLAKWIAKKGGVFVLLMIGDLIQPNELDEEVDQLKKRVDMLEIILKKEK